MNRRQFLTASLGLTGASMLTSREGLASMESESERNFLFVFAQGGWDPTRVFTPEFDNARVAMETDAEPNQMGSLRWVSHVSRPSVDTFFESHYDKTMIVNGVQVRSIAHEICTSLLFTGGVSGDGADWATRIASETSRVLPIPHLVLGGPSFAGDLGAMVVRTGSSNQLEDVLNRSILERSNTSVPTLSTPSQEVLDRYIQRRVQVTAEQAFYGADARLSSAYKMATDNAMELKERRHTMTFSSGSLSAQLECAVDAIAKGISRCTSVVFTGSDGLGWDSHADNDVTQSQLFEALFGSLNQLMYQLQNRTDQYGTVLAENTTIVVCSEMGRTAKLNGTNGKDHWPFTSVMMFGAGISSNRVIGGLDDNYQGRRVDLATGDLDDNGQVLSIESVGAGLLSLAGLDPSEHILDADPLLGMLS